MQINYDADKICVAPMHVFDKSLKSAFEQKIIYLMADWEMFSGNSAAYGQEKMLYPGCYVKI